MKKIIFSFFAIIVGFSLLQSCQKESISNSDKLNEFDNITNSYLATTNRNGTQLKPRWMKILGADLKGMLAGAGTGAGIGAAVGAAGGPAGAASAAATGAVIGGIVGGAGASLEAGYETASKKADYNPSSNSQNPFDYIGKNHYQAINQSLESTSYYSSNGVFSEDNFYNFTKNLLINNNIVRNINFQYFSINDNSNVLNFVRSDEENTISEFLSNYDNEYITQNIKYILGQYFDALTSTKNESEFVSYSITVENLISNSTELTSMDKQIILSTMSTARYGIQYWGIQ